MPRKFPAEKRIILRTIALSVVWSLLIGGSVLWNVHQIRQESLKLAMTQAEAFLGKDLAFRKWASGRGGLYLALGPKVAPSPYLAHVPRRDLETTDGVALTLRNPAMIINEIMLEHSDQYGIKTRITGFKYLNPLDAPDAWEQKALAIVDRTRQNYHEIITADGKQVLRMMQPMLMEESCQKCHAWTGIRNGELRGATDISIPLDQFTASLAGQSVSIIKTHFLIWLLGMTGVFFFSRRTIRQERERADREALLREKNEQLEREVLERKSAEMRLAAIFDFLPDATFVVDNEQRVIAWNRAIEQMTGISKEKIIGEGDHACTIPFYGERRRHLIDLIDCSDEELSARYKDVTRKDGILYAEAFTPALYNGAGAYVWATVAQLRDQSGEVLGVIESIRDISSQKRLENELRNSRQHLQDIIDFLPDATMIIDKSGRILVWSREMTRLTGISSAEMIGRDNYQYAIPFYGKRRPILIDLALNPALAEQQNYVEIVRHGDIVYGESYVSNLRGQSAYLSATASVLRNAAGEIVGAIECIRDNTDKKEAERRISLLAKIFENSAEGIMITDEHNKIIEVNKSFSRLTGYSSEDVLHQNPRILKSGIEGKEFYQGMWDSIHTNNYWQGEIWDKRKDGSIYPKWLIITAIRDDSDRIINYFASFSDITERKQAEQRIQHMAHTDSLTQLPNRHTLVERLSQALELAKRSNELIAVMFIDLDRFKNINDSLGHHIGDLLLFEVASRLKELLRSADIVARFGGDEFVVVLPALHSEMEAVHIAQKIQHSISAPYLFENHQVYTTPSIGISMFPHDGTTVPELLKHADTAMYHAKSHGRNTYQLFTSAMHSLAQHRLDLENSLRKAVEREEFVVYYQPQIQTQTGDLQGFEALVRWCSPEHGLVMPASFIPVAEETGLILAIGEQVIRQVCRQKALWRDAGMSGFRVAINLSMRQLRQPEFPEILNAIIGEHGILAADIELEVTESMTMDHPEENIAQFNRLKDMGISLAIDDFGTGYSSLSYLKLFPVDKLKIDRSFVKDMESDNNDAAIAAAAIALAHTLGMKVVAEGVETEGQLDLLRQQGCDIIQGYYYGKPMPACEAELFLREKTSAGSC